MMNNTLHALPVPDIIEPSLNHSFKFNVSNENRRAKKPPKLFPKENSFIRNGHHEVHAISFKEQNSSIAATSTPKSSSSSSSRNDYSLFSSFYDKNRNNSYFEQCFETVSKLGEGSFGEVFKVRCRDDGKFYAIKKTKQIFRSENYRRERLEEVKRYEQFSENEHCVTLFKAWEQNDLLFMQIELCWGSVEDYVRNGKKVTEAFVWSFLLDMLLALKSLHDKNLVHLDIKLDNILMTEENYCKLADFGLVFDLDNSPRTRATEGDSRYLAPELMQGNYCLANDIFSLGITLLELACNLALPMNGELWQELRTSILPESAMRSLSSELQSIIRSMMEPNPKNRPSVDDLLKSPRLRALNYKRKVDKISKLCTKKVVNGLHFFKSYVLFMFYVIFEFLKLERMKQNALTVPPTSCGIKVQIHHYDEDSDDNESSFKTSMNSSRVSKVSCDDDNNNLTPTLNISVPRNTKIVNSTPLNHYNQHEGSSSRKFRRDLTKAGFNPTSPVGGVLNGSQDRESFTICKKLCFQDEELDEP